MYAAEIGRLAGVRVPIVPFAHEYLVTQPFRDRREPAPADAARPRPPHLLPRGGRRPGDGRLRAQLRAVGAARRRPRLDEIPPDFNGRLLEEDWDRFEEIVVNSRKARPAMEDVKVTKLDQRPRGVHARRRVLPRGDRGARPLRRRRLLRARPRRRRRHRQGDGGVDRRRRAVARPLAHGHPPLRRALPLPAYTLDAHPRGLRDLLRHQVPQPRAPGRPAAADVVRLPVARGARRGVRREVRLGARQLVRVQRGGGRRGAAPARVGRGCTGRPRSAPSTAPAARRPRCSTSPRSPSSRSPGPGAAEFLERLCDNRVAREVGTGHVHADAQPPRRDRVRLHRHAAGGRSLRHRHRHRVRQPRPRAGSARHLPRGGLRRRPGRRRHVAVGVLRALGPERARRARRLHDRRPRQRGVPVHDVRRTSTSATSPCARCA